jgi:hypothetical protein
MEVRLMYNVAGWFSCTIATTTILRLVHYYYYDYYVTLVFALFLTHIHYYYYYFYNYLSVRATTMLHYYNNHPATCSLYNLRKEIRQIYKLFKAGIKYTTTTHTYAQLSTLYPLVNV